MAYESEAQEVLVLLESRVQNAKQPQHARLSWHVRSEIYRPRKPRQ
jgi:hypothetical protein